MPAIKLWGFNNSTYVRTVKMLLAEKGVTDIEQVPVNVLAGEPKSPEHLARHPFGKVPVVDVDGFRVIETPAIAAYLDAVLPGRRLIPAEPKAMARSAMTVSILDSYGYGALIGGVVAYHLFPDFVGGRNEAMHAEGLTQGRRVLDEIMKIRGGDRFIAGADVSLADLYLAPIMAYVVMTPHRDAFMALQGVAGWWDAITARDSFKATEY